jgi:hypothetical protein
LRVSVFVSFLLLGALELENENGLHGKQEKIELVVHFLTPASGAAAAEAGAALLRSGGRC